MDVPMLATFNTILDNRHLEFEFQPIADIVRAEVLGYEALVRGPAGSLLRSPEDLLRLAKQGGRLCEFELAACHVAVAQFGALALPGKLFLNVSALAIEALAHDEGNALLRALRMARVSPERIVLELTEHERVDNLPQLHASMQALARHRISFAIDDFGDGRSSLRLWVQLRPELVKLDKYFIRDLLNDPRKMEVIRAVLRLAEVLGTPLVAEGIEDPAELTVLRDLGCHYAQGYCIGRPTIAPAAKLSMAVMEVLGSSKISVLPSPPSPRAVRTLEHLMHASPAVPPDLPSGDVMRLFGSNPGLHAIAVVDGDRPVGIINRRGFIEKYAQPFHRELYGRTPVRQFMNPEPACAERNVVLDSLVDVFARDDQRYLCDGIIVTHHGRYAGLATAERVMRAIGELRIEAARHANPLTLLPGNIPLTAHIERLLAARTNFAACYFDLNNFKPYNDLYGYWRGDRMIKLAAGVITANSDRTMDFVGHVGGDDFVVLFQSDDWSLRCDRIIEQFNLEARDLFDPAELQAGGFYSEDRRGFRAYFPLTTIVIGQVVVAPGRFVDAGEVASAAAAAKKMAKLAQCGVHQEHSAEIIHLDEARA